MGRMQTGGQHFTEVRIDTRLDGDRAERVQAHLEDADLSGADLVRKALDEYLGTDEPDGPYIRPPETEDLRQALTILQRLAEPNNGTVPREVARSELAQQFSRSTQACETTLIQPLAREGYLRERGGWRARQTLGVVLPSDVPRIIENVGISTETDEDTTEDDTQEFDDPETARERLTELAEAGEEAAES